MKLTENDWNFLNDLIFKVHSIPELDKMRYAFLEFIRIIIPCDGLSFFLADHDHNGNKYMRDPIESGLAPIFMQRYLDELGEIDYKRWIFMTAQNKAYRTTDFFSDGMREKHPYYQKAYVPLNIHYEAILSLSHNDVFVGVVSLYRSIDKTDFSDKDIAVLEVLKNHLSYRLYREFSDADLVKYKDFWQKRLDTIMKKYGLTSRELDVLSYIIRGEKNIEICKQLYISSSTLKKHTNNIYKKLDINSRIELFKFIAPT